MNKYKTGLMIFLFLAIVISLFPPFEWGNENINTEKKYDFLFSYNNKYLPIGSYGVERKVYLGEEMNIDTSDIITSEFSNGVDTFFINKYKVKRPSSVENNDVRKKGKINFNFDAADFGFEKYEKDLYNEIKQRTGNADTIQHYKIYKLVKPHWFLLQRRLILNELILEYLLAGFIAFFVQIVITFAKRKTLNEK